ncbi:hypothetical protein PMI02_01999, partial [Novosphingobium sp. AP12]
MSGADTFSRRALLATPAVLAFVSTSACTQEKGSGHVRQCG